MSSWQPAVTYDRRPPIPPFAEVPLSAETFASFPQLAKVREGEMAWTDREDL